jgi:uncharacterized RDD family membrane protein YckC
MSYYYNDGNRQVGPVNKAQLMELVKSGKVTAKTKIMTSDRPEWVELGNMLARLRQDNGGGAAVKPAAPPVVRPRPVREEAAVQAEPAVKKTPCAQCGVEFVHSELVRLNNQWLCPVCKVEFVQMMKEGVRSSADMRYAGFWIRFVALLIDGIAMQALSFLAILPIVYWMDGMEDMGLVASWFIAQQDYSYIGFFVAVAYAVFFVGRFGATPGKMALGLLIVTEDGGRVGYLRAFCRYLSTILSGIILCIGYLMAAFDGEKRALHDRICSTRVIRK